MMDMFYRNHVLQKSLRSILTIFTGNWNTEQRRKREDVKLPGDVINRSEDQNVEWVVLQYIAIIYRLAFFYFPSMIAMDWSIFSHAGNTCRIAWNNGLGILRQNNDFTYIFISFSLDCDDFIFESESLIRLFLDKCFHI